MAHSNEDLARRGYDAFTRGDMQAVSDVFADDIVWHVGGRSPLAGDYRGKDEVLGFLAKTMELSGGTFRVEIHDVLANEEHVTVLVVARAEREGKTLEDRQAHVLHVKDGKVTEYWGHPGDQYAIDEFFS
ncbi:MAG TPA: nuclear transport factor 2 family protein [Actinomycetota bacterium]|nr:nuclear transport factor 2 family protein [Actinomycetota bacterium]